MLIIIVAFLVIVTSNEGVITPNQPPEDLIFGIFKDM